MQIVTYKIAITPEDQLTLDQRELVKNKPNLVDAVLRSIDDQGSTGSQILSSFNERFVDLLDLPSGDPTNFVYETVLQMLAARMLKTEISYE